MGEIVLDIETQNTFAEVGNDIKGLKVSVVVVYDYETGEYKSYKEDQLNNMWPVLEQADRIIGYNSNYFDLPVLNNYYPGDLTKLPQLDMLVEVKKNLGNRLRLNDIAKATLKIEKSGDGLGAIEYFRKGDWESLTKYCKDDVKITRDIYEFGKKNKQLFFNDIMTGDTRPFPVNFDPPAPEDLAAQESGVNLSLPF